LGEDFAQGDAGDPPGSLDYGLWMNNVPRPGVSVFCTCARMLDDAEFDSDLKVNRDITGYFFSKPGGSLATLWTTRTDTVPLKVTLPAGTRLYNIMGDQVVIGKSANGITTLPLTQEPLFLTSPLTAQQLAAKLSNATCSLPKMVATARPGRFRTIDVYVSNQTDAPLTLHIDASLTGGARLLKSSIAASAPGSSLTCVSFPYDDRGAIGWTGKFSAKIKAAGSAPVVVDAPVNLFPVRRVPTGSRPDGDFAKYANISPIVLDSPQDVNCPSGPADALKIWKGPDDLSMKVWFAWDASYLYFAASVTDDYFVQEQTGSQIWSQDGFQLAFDTLANAVPPAISGISGFRDVDYQYGIALTKIGPQGYCWWAAKVNEALAADGLTKFTPSIVRVSPTLTNYEYAIPWSALAPMQPKLGAVFGFNLNYVDADAPGDSARDWMQLSPGLTEGKNPSAYRQFVLTE
jgi:hypothetical protein